MTLSSRDKHRTMKRAPVSGSLGINLFETANGFALVKGEAICRFIFI